MKKLEKIKQIYFDINPPGYLMRSGWKRVLLNISDSRDPEIIKRPRKIFFSMPVFGFVVIVMLFFTNSINDSLPGSYLYSIKVLSEKVVKTLTGSNQIGIENRAREIVKLVKKAKQENQTDHIQETVQKYEQEVKEARTNPDFSDSQRDQLEQRLEEQHRNFENVAEDTPVATAEIQKALAVSTPERTDEESVASSEAENKIEITGTIPTNPPVDGHLIVRPSLSAPPRDEERKKENN